MKGTLKSRGFTLIELLVVVGIIGVLMAILIPVFQGAIQKTKQKATMSDIAHLSKVIMSYISDFGQAPTSPGGALESDSPFVQEVAPFQAKRIALYDQWGGNFFVWTGFDVAGQFGISQEDIGREDFLIQSRGRDSQDDGYTFDLNDPDSGFYVVDDMEDFNKDLIMWNGSWIHAPRASGS